MGVVPLGSGRRETVCAPAGAPKAQAAKVRPRKASVRVISIPFSKMRAPGPRMRRSKSRSRLARLVQDLAHATAHDQLFARLQGHGDDLQLVLGIGAGLAQLRKEAAIALGGQHLDAGLAPTQYLNALRHGQAETRLVPLDRQGGIGVAAD